MREQDILMQEGMNLLYSGMVVVFSFLLLLIISVNLLRIVFSSEAQGTELTAPKNPKNDVHQKIIKEVFEGTRS